MASSIPDRYVWVGLGLFTIAAAYAIRHAITDITELTTLPETWGKEEESDAGKEPSDDLSIETLKTLYLSPNAHISNSAVSIAMQRFASLPNISEEMYDDYNSSNPAARHRARTIMKFLQTRPLPPEMDRILPIRPADADVVMSSLRRNATAHVGGNSSVGDPEVVPRFRSGSPEMQARVWAQRQDRVDAEETRRSRREAVVVHEGDGEITAENIHRFEESGPRREAVLVREGNGGLIADDLQQT